MKAPRKYSKSSPRMSKFVGMYKKHVETSFLTYYFAEEI